LKPGENEYKHCLYGHIEVCSAPCVGKVSLDQYRLQVENACDFFDGHCSKILSDLEQAMTVASDQKDYERAARLRDQITALKDTTRKTTRYRKLPNQLPISLDPQNDLMELANILDLPSPPACIEGFDISNISGTFMVASMVVFRNGRPANADYRKYKIKGVAVQDDFACMAEVVRRRYSRLIKEEREMPDLVLVDGGKGQLSSALKSLSDLGLGDLNVIGLAKEFEEIYVPGGRDPIRLGLDNNSLRLLQRIRDESHRFANNFNADLRVKKISESILDEFTGIGDKRKTALLKHFGSVKRLKEASLVDIIEVPGFGLKTAQALKDFLVAREAG
jgi:excinuclease ABC subunit C